MNPAIEAFSAVAKFRSKGSIIHPWTKQVAPYGLQMGYEGSLDQNNSGLARCHILYWNTSIVTLGAYWIARRIINAVKLPRLGHGPPCREREISVAAFLLKDG
jgi:hypothetical protein